MEGRQRIVRGEAAPDVEDKLGQMKQKLSSLDFIDAIDKELELSQADNVAAKYARNDVVSSMRELRFPSSPSRYSAGSVHSGPPRFLSDPSENDSLHCQIMDLEAGFTRLSKLMGQPVDNNIPESQRAALLRREKSAPDQELSPIEDPLTFDFRRAKSQGRVS
ncbi:hypothetical protein RvY_04723 [Ramazzottius varieornatus]|uniref:Uncharacterized protein n=1 Tax=Ramazzottius varieornatus TaxID=947166 RepID=A0A1D1USL4_RAMVA|nr:hypothetical protein RvY_04723 [Ramazzottius varieornatus]